MAKTFQEITITIRLIPNVAPTASFTVATGSTDYPNQQLATVSGDYTPSSSALSNTMATALGNILNAACSAAGVTEPDPSTLLTPAS